MSAASPAIELEDVWLSYGRVPALAGVTLSLGIAETLAVLGPSGSGKTSLLRVILGLSAPDRGRVRIVGETVSADGVILRNPEKRRLAVVFQDLALWPHMTVAENLSFGLEAQRVPRPEVRRRVSDMLERVSLGGMAMRYPAQLSGGERQRVAIARALVLEPLAVLFDEPLSNLDIVLRQELIALVKSLLAERGASAVYVTHDPREAALLARRIGVLAGGRIVACGDVEQLRRNPPTGDGVRALLGELLD